MRSLVQRACLGCAVGWLGAFTTASAATWSDSAGGVYGDSGNWVSGNIANGSTETAVFPGSLGATPFTVSFDSGYNIGQLDVNGTLDVTFDLNGYIYRAKSSNTYIRNGARTVFTDGVFSTAGGSSPRELRVEAGSTLIVDGANAYGFGGVNGVVVNGTAELISGSLNAKQDPAIGGSTRDFYVGSAGVFRYAGGASTGRYIKWQDGSTFVAVLPSGGVSTAAVVYSDVRGLGNLEIELSPGFTASVGQVFNLIALSFPSTSSYSFNNIRFDNAAQGALITAGNYVFEVNYSSGLVSLEVVQANATPPSGPYSFSNSAGGSYNLPQNWSSGFVPSVDNTVLFGASLNGRQITFSDDGAAKNVNGDAGSYSLSFDLNGHTWSLANQSEIKGNYTVLDGIIESTNRFVVHTGATFTLGAGVTVKATGGLDQVAVNGGGTLSVAAGRLQQNTGTRDVRAASGGTIHFTGAGGTVNGRYAQLQDGSTLRFTLANTGYASAPLTLSDVRALGELDIVLDSGFVAQEGSMIPLVALASPQSGYGFDNIKFDNATQGASISVGGYVFQAIYSNGALSLEVVDAIGQPTPLDGRVEGLVELNYYVNEPSAKAVFDITPGPMGSNVVARAVVDLPSGPDIVAEAPVNGVGLTEVSIPLGGLAVGSYPVLLSIREGGTATWTGSDTLVKRAPPAAGARITQVDRYRRVLVVDGQRYFPIGIYGIFPEFLPDIATNTNFNWTLRWKGATVWPRWDRTLSAGTAFNRQSVVRDYLDAVQAAGLYNPSTRQGLYVFENPPKLAEKEYYVRFNDVPARYPDEPPYWADKHPVHNGTITPGVVQNAKDHPAVIGYYNYDEPDNFYPDEPSHSLHLMMQPAVEQWYSIVRAADPHHPVLTLFSIGFDAPKYVAEWEAHDMVGRDVYLMLDDHMSKVYDKARADHDEAWALRLPYLLTPLAEDSDGRPVPMSPEEQRASTYLAVVADVKGVTHWEWPVAYGPSWDMLKSLASELSDLSPILLERAPAQSVSYSPASLSDSLKVLLKNHNGRSYLIAVNAETAPVTVNFQLPSRYSGQAQVLFEDRSETLSGGAFADTFEPYGRHVYEMPAGITWVPGETISLGISKGADVIPPDPHFPADPVNLVVNSSFEADYGRLPGWPYGWSTGSGIMESGTAGVSNGRWATTTSASPPHGYRSMRLIKDTVGVGNSDDISNILGVVPEARALVHHPAVSQYTISMDLKIGELDTKVGVMVNGAYLAQFRPTHTNWQRYWFPAYSVSGPKDVEVRIMLLGNGKSTSTLHIDRVQIEQGNVTGTAYSYTPPN